MVSDPELQPETKHDAAIYATIARSALASMKAVIEKEAAAATGAEKAALEAQRAEIEAARIEVDRLKEAEQSKRRVR